MAVFVRDRRGKPLMPCSEKRARLLLARGRARVHQMLPFCIRLVDRRVEDSTLQPLRLKLDPGSKTTGIALVRDTDVVNTDTGEIERGAAVLNLFELQHRGAAIRKGTLQGYEVREYVLERDGRRCAYCDAEQVPLTLDHVLAKANGGSDRVSNLTPACQPCNTAKGAIPVEVYLADDPERLARIRKQLRAPLRDAAAVNSTRWALWRKLVATHLPVEAASGGRTKRNRHRFSMPKTHALDAVCIGAIGAITDWQRPTLTVLATGRGAYQRTRLTAHGFPRGYLMRTKAAHGFRTGDFVLATVATGKKVGIHLGRVAMRASGSFNIQTDAGVVQGIHHRHCRKLQRGDGYGYQQKPLNSIHSLSLGALSSQCPEGAGYPARQF